MKNKNLISSVLLLFFITTHSTAISAQTVEEILEKMIDAQGGRSVLQGIQDTTLIGTMEMPGMGYGGSLKTYQKEPNMLRMDAEVQGTLITQAYDGEKAWMTNPFTGGTEEMPEPMAKDFIRSSLGNDALLHPEKYGIVYKLEGQKAVEGYEYYVLNQQFTDGFKATLYIDPVTFFIYKTTNTAVDGAGNESLVETVFSDYKKVETLTMAHSIVTFQDGKEFMKMEIIQVKFNTGLEDSFFRMGGKPRL
jgi:outer membrane lipoprotein-sorting protein